MNAVTVTAKRWRGGWELWLEDGRVTQSRTLASARDEVIDYLDTDEPAVDHSQWEVVIVPSIEYGDEVRAAREATQVAAEAQERAAARSRALVRKLSDEGLSVTDTAWLLGVSRGRVSQLKQG